MNGHGIAILFIIAGALSQVATTNTIRWIQARTRNVYATVISNYVVAALIALAFLARRHPDPTWGTAVAIGIPGGFFYTAALLTIIRSMGQRGLAMTVAFAGVSQLVPSLIALLMGDSLGWLQGIGLLVAAVSIPLLSTATASGIAIRERPSVRLAALLFVLQGGAMSSNLFASKWVAPASFPVYLVSLFGSGLVMSIILALARGVAAGKGPLLRGALFGLLNAASTIIIVVAVTYVNGALFFAGMSVMGLTLTALIAVLGWRERLQIWGWIGLCLAGLSLVLLNN